MGVDPGVTTGLFSVRYSDGCFTPEPLAVQIHGSEGVVPFMQTILGRQGADVVVVIAVEQFVVGSRAARSSSAHAGRVTRALVAELHDLGPDVFIRAAAMVKPWATDQRLSAAHLLDCTKGMPHARDAARQALYAAVHMGVTSDPLSRKAAAR